MPKVKQEKVKKAPCTKSKAFLALKERLKKCKANGPPIRGYTRAKNGVIKDRQSLTVDGRVFKLYGWKDNNGTRSKIVRGKKGKPDKIVALKPLKPSKKKYVPKKIKVLSSDNMLVESPPSSLVQYAQGITLPTLHLNNENRIYRSPTEATLNALTPSQQKALMKALPAQKITVKKEKGGKGIKKEKKG